ncbi:MAG: DUF3943 domain-containing protein [Ignavibacteriaceae bacterium]
MAKTNTSTISPLYYLISFLASILLFPSINAQTINLEDVKTSSKQFNSSLHKAILNANSLLGSLNLNDRKSLSLAIDYNKLDVGKNMFRANDSIDHAYLPHDATKHFWLGVGEIAILEFIPWSLARWIRHWDDPADNWAKVSSKTWWQNISQGWEYDGDNFTTNNFAHPYHGSLFFNAGRTNGYDFWESTAWSLSGSAVWEFFGETFRPAFNDWIYTGIGGVNLGEIFYRLSSMVTDNTASGSERVWSEIFGTLINPVRGFNRAISGEMGRNFPNPKWSRPDDFLIAFDAGTRSIDKDGDNSYTDKDVEGIFNFHLYYGNRFKAKKPFEFFGFNFALASGSPHFTTLNSSGFLFGYNLEKNKHRFDVNLDFNYNNLIKEEISGTDTVYNGFLFGTTQLYPHIASKFPIGEKTNLETQIGINAILMGATPNDYYVDVEGRNYDFGPGVGTRIVASIQNGIWNYVSLLYYGAWLWTQTEPSDSRHHIHFLIVEAQYPFTPYFSVGISAGIYWRNSYYDNYPDVTSNHPMGRIFFRTAIIDI